MSLEWMGRYRELIEQLQRFGNRYAVQYNREICCGPELCLSTAQLQILGYLLENEEKNLKMAQVAQALDILQSTFSKCISRMVEKGLVEKYHTSQNRKDVIIRASARGREAWLHYGLGLYTAYQQFFSALEGVPDEMLRQFSFALSGLLSADASKEEKPEGTLVPIGR